MRKCIECSKQLETYAKIYCSNQCQRDFQYKQYIKSWKEGLVEGSRGIMAKNISKHVYKYLHIKFESSCSICGWNKRNLLTGKVPLEIDHIDGNSDNNIETNLRLLCPNCHSLTSTFKNLIKGKGREWRRLKYVKT